MTRVLRDARLASGLVMRSGRLLQGELVPPSSRSSSSASTTAGGPPKRCATALMLETLTSGLAAVREPRLVRERFEEELRALVRATSVTFRHDGDETRPNVVMCEVPGSPPFERRSWLEAVFDPTRPADDRARQTLAAGAQVAGLLLEMERANGRWPLASARSRSDGAAPLIGSSLGIRTVRDRIERVAATDFTVLIEGESGTGKELVARQIHELSRRRKAPFVAVNCAAIVETLIEAELFGIEERTATGVKGRRGKFEHAQDGTLFLDEVSDLSPSAQAKLLRAIQDLSVERVGGCGARRVDTRIIVASNRSLTLLVEQGRFRLDLYYRLNGVDIQVPPLRYRKDERHRADAVLPGAAPHFQALVVVGGRDGCASGLQLAGQRSRTRTRH